jgi:hypothetical protein
MDMCLSTALSLGKENTKTIALNGFLASYFKGYINELEDILIEAINVKQKHEAELVNKIIKEYCEDMQNV